VVLALIKVQPLEHLGHMFTLQVFLSLLEIITPLQLLQAVPVVQASQAAQGEVVFNQAVMVQ
jgi:hypothetical protein